MNLEIVPLYAIPLGLAYIALTLRVVRARGTARRPIGPLGDERLDRRIRVHGNFAEYVPLALLLLAFAELRGAPAAALHVGGALLVLGRGLHAWGVSQVPENIRWRVAGMIATIASLATGLAQLLFGYL